MFSEMFSEYFIEETLRNDKRKTKRDLEGLISREVKDDEIVKCIRSEVYKPAFNKPLLRAWIKSHVRADKIM